jgi:hypothetical protein
MKGEDAIYIRSASLLLHALRRISYLVASRYPPAVAPIRDRAAAFQTSTLDRTEPRRMLSCWSLRCQLSHANLINGWI